MHGWLSLDGVVDDLGVPPYFVAESRAHDCETELRAAGFAVVEADVTGAADERAVLAVLGAALDFPSYYGQNWAAFEDCMSDKVAAGGGGLILEVRGLQRLMVVDMRAFVRTIHNLLFVVAEIERGHPTDFQFDVLFVGDFSA